MGISILLADDHPVVREGLRSVLVSRSGFTIVGETGDGREAVELAERLQPDVMILDLTLPGLSGLDVLPIVRQRSPRTHPVVFSMHTNEDFVLRAIRGGAFGFVSKGSSPSHLIEAIEMAAAGKRYLGPTVSGLAFDAFYDMAQAIPPDPHDMLTPREREVLQLLAEGESNIEVADRLSISPRTVEMHRANAMNKLGLRSQADLIHYAIRRGMISPETEVYAHASSRPRMSRHSARSARTPAKT